MNNFLFSLNATVPVFAVIVLGHFFKRIGLIDEHFAGVANKFVFKACLPCLVFQDLADTNIRKNFDFQYVGFCFIATLTSILVIWFLAKKFMRDKSMVGAFVQGSYRSSAAILGIAFIHILAPSFCTQIAQTCARIENIIANSKGFVKVNLLKIGELQ